LPVSGLQPGRGLGAVCVADQASGPGGESGIVADRPVQVGRGGPAVDRDVLADRGQGAEPVPLAD
jgi:hypothetical protein